MTHFSIWQHGGLTYIKPPLLFSWRVSKKAPFSSFCHAFVADIQEKGITFAPENSEIVIRIMFNRSPQMEAPQKKERKQIMMLTVMIFAVVAVMLAEAVNVNNKIEMGK